MNSKCLIALGMMLFCAALPAAVAATLISGIQAADINEAARPQNDFFDYANGAWLRKVQIPPDRSRYGVDVMMDCTRFGGHHL